MYPQQQNKEGSLGFIMSEFHNSASEMVNHEETIGDAAKNKQQPEDAEDKVAGSEKYPFNELDVVEGEEATEKSDEPTHLLKQEEILPVVCKKVDEMSKNDDPDIQVDSRSQEASRLENYTEQESEESEKSLEIDTSGDGKRTLEDGEGGSKLQEKDSEKTKISTETQEENISLGTEAPKDDLILRAEANGDGGHASVSTNDSTVSEHGQEQIQNSNEDSHGSDDNCDIPPKVSYKDALLHNKSEDPLEVTVVSDDQEASSETQEHEGNTADDGRNVSQENYDDSKTENLFSKHDESEPVIEEHKLIENKSVVRTESNDQSGESADDKQTMTSNGEMNGEGVEDLLHKTGEENSETQNVQPSLKEVDMLFNSDSRDLTNGNEKFEHIKAIPGEENALNESLQNESSPLEKPKDFVVNGRDQNPVPELSESSEAESIKCRKLEEKDVSVTPTVTNSTSPGYSGLNLPARPAWQETSKESTSSMSGYTGLNLPARPIGHGTSKETGTKEITSDDLPRSTSTGYSGVNLPARPQGHVSRGTANKEPTSLDDASNNATTGYAGLNLPARPQGNISRGTANKEPMSLENSSKNASTDYSGLNLPARPAMKEATAKEPTSSHTSASTASAAPSLPARPVSQGSSNASPQAVSTSADTQSRPAGLGSSAPLLEPASRSANHTRSNSDPLRLNAGDSEGGSELAEEQNDDEADENDETREKLQAIRVKFLRLAKRLGQTPHNVVVAQVLYRLGLAEQLRGSRTSSRTGGFSFDKANAIAEQLENTGREGLDFACTIMLLGKTGVGKSATINSIFDEVKSETDPFHTGTKKVKEVIGTVEGIKIRIIDTPGLQTSFADQHYNEKILKSVKQFTKNSPPDIVLYFDRLDMQCRDYSDLPLLKTITDVFGSSVWFNAIVVLTHAASAPPDGPNGTPMSYEMFVAQRSHVVQQAVRQAASDMRLMNPVSLVENHSACRTNRAGQRVLPNGQIWKPQLLLLCFASKVLAEANTLLKLQDTTSKAFGSRRSPPLPFILSSLLQSRQQLALPGEQYGDEGVTDEDLDDASDKDEEDEFDNLPPFRHLSKKELAKLDKKARREYYDELHLREKLFIKKQLKAERQRRKMIRKMAKEKVEQIEEDMEEPSGSDSVPVPMPDMALPPTFDSDNPSYRYRYVDGNNQWFVRPVLDTHGWDHDVGYEGVNFEKMFVVAGIVLTSISGQITKDKKEENLQLECVSSLKHGEDGATLTGMELQTVGKDLGCTLRYETAFKNFKCNKTTGGLSITKLGDTTATGVKIENKVTFGNWLKMVLNGGVVVGQGDMTYGGSLETTLRSKEYPVGRWMSTFGVSVMNWHGDLAVGGNLQAQVPLGDDSAITARANLNNRGSGQISIRTSSSEHLSLAMLAAIPIVKHLWNKGLLFFNSSE